MILMYTSRSFAFRKFIYIGIRFRMDIVFCCGEAVSRVESGRAAGRAHCRGRLLSSACRHTNYGSLSHCPHRARGSTNKRRFPRAIQSIRPYPTDRVLCILHTSIPRLRDDGTCMRRAVPHAPSRHAFTLTENVTAHATSNNLCPLCGAFGSRNRKTYSLQPSSPPCPLPVLPSIPAARLTIPPTPTKRVRADGLNRAADPSLRLLINRGKNSRLAAIAALVEPDQ
jgi:hypothetical protein